MSQATPGHDADADVDGSVADTLGAPGRRALDLGDELDSRATEDRPEAWGERTESDADRWAHYEAQRPPHHGG